MHMPIDCETRTFTVDEYIKMLERGILREDERTELVDGTIVVMPPIKADHNAKVLRVSDIVCRRLGELALVQTPSTSLTGHAVRTTGAIRFLLKLFRRSNSRSRISWDPPKAFLLSELPQHGAGEVATVARGRRAAGIFISCDTHHAAAVT
jgi:hypothetical protein